MTVSEIINLYYTTPEMTPEQANELLKEHKSNIRLETRWNIMTPEQKATTVENLKHGEVTGWAMVDVQVGGFECVKVEKGKVVSPIGFETDAFMADRHFLVVDGEKFKEI